MKARLTEEAINKIRGRMRNDATRHIWGDINTHIGLSRSSNRIYDILARNEWNSKLTNVATVQYLEEALNMSREELLETVDE